MKPKIKDLFYSGDELRYIEFDINDKIRILSYENFLKRFSNGEELIKTEIKRKKKGAIKS